MERLRRIMGSQASNDWVSGQLLGYNNAASHIDALAIAPYFGNALPFGTEGAAEAAAFKAMTPQERVALGWQGVNDAIADMQDQKAATDAAGVDLVAYEAGQHFLGNIGQSNDAELTAAFIALNRDPAMRDMYLTYLQGWQAAGGDDIMLFDTTGKFGGFGSWGLRENETISEDLSPKLQGVLDFLARQGDVDGTSTIGPSDIDTLFNAINSSNSDQRFDLNDDGNVDQRDADHWVDSLANTFYGDSNLDGVIAQVDLDAVLLHWGQQNAGWELGDYNGDGIVSQSDLDTVLLGWGSGLDPLFTNLPQGAVVVPEPTTALGMIGLGSLLITRRRKHGRN